MLNEKPAIDLNFTAQSFNHGQVTVHMTWHIPTRQPCMALVPTFAQLSAERITPCLVTQRNAWQWAEETGDPRDTAQACAEFAVALGFAPERQTCFTIRSIITDHLQDLLMMPPMPRHETDQVVADVIVTDTNTGKQRSGEVRDVR